MRYKSVLSLILSGMLSVAMFYLALRNVPLTDLIAYLDSFNYFWIIPTIGLVLLSFFLRAVRWRLILKSAYPIEFRYAFHILMIGFMMNCILPARVGEIARPLILRQRHGVPITVGLATVAAERIFDIVMLMSLFALVYSTLSKQPDQQVVFGDFHLNTRDLQSIALAMLRLVVVLFIGLALLMMSWSRRLIVLLLNHCARLVGGFGPRTRHWSERITIFFIGIIDNIAVGLGLVRHPRQLITCLIVTALIWGLTLLSYWLFALGSPQINLSLLEWTTVMVAICIFIALPSVPGFWGVWEAGGVFALSLFGISAMDAAGFILLNHVTQLLPVIVVGWISTLAISIKIRQVSTGKNQTSDIKPIPAK